VLILIIRDCNFINTIFNTKRLEGCQENNFFSSCFTFSQCITEDVNFHFRNLLVSLHKQVLKLQIDILIKPGTFIYKMLAR